jgi:hypothetical protein
MDATEGESETTPKRELSYDDVDINLTAGYKPAAVVALATLVSLVLLGGGLPIHWEAGEGGYTLLTYTAPLWGVVIVALGFIYEYWVEKKENARDSA